MLKTLIVLLILISIKTYSRETVDYVETCNWYNELHNTNDVGYQLKIIKENFQEFSSYEKNDSCRVLFIGNLNSRRFILSNDTDFNMHYPELFINELKVQDIDTLFLFDKKAAQTLYGLNRLVYIGSSSTALEKRMVSIIINKKN